MVLRTLAPRPAADSAHYTPGKPQLQLHRALQLPSIPVNYLKFGGLATSCGLAEAPTCNKGDNGMNGILKRFIVLATAFALVAIPCSTCFAQGLEQDGDIIAGKMAGDALVVRPLGLCATLIGGAIFIVSLPFSALGGNTGPAYDSLVVDPFTFTFNRPLGDF
jgi:hypothetical protein